jgi:serine/threonine-protein kinase RsbW
MESDSAPSTRFKKGVWYSIDIRSVSQETIDVEEAIIEALAQTQFSEEDVFAVRLALDEALANAIKHGNCADAGKCVSIRFCFDDDRITITVKDEGPGFDFSCVPDCTDDDRLELPSGRGLLIMKSYMDRVLFNETGNEVTLIKGRGNGKCDQ